MVIALVYHDASPALLRDSNCCSLYILREFAVPHFTSFDPSALFVYLQLILLLSALILAPAFDSNIVYIYASFGYFTVSTLTITLSTFFWTHSIIIISIAAHRSVVLTILYYWTKANYLTAARKCSRLAVFTCRRQNAT